MDHFCQHVVGFVDATNIKRSDAVMPQWPAALDYSQLLYSAVSTIYIGSYCHLDK